MTKQCKTCGKTKLLSEFPKHHKDKYRPHCKTCYNASQRVYREDPSNTQRVKKSWKEASKKHYTSDRRRAKTLTKYGLTPQQYDDMYTAQQGKCKICGEKVALVVDHSHVTNKVRGLLCNPCNLALGLFRDNPSRLQQAMVYLKNTSQ